MDHRIGFAAAIALAASAGIAQAAAYEASPADYRQTVKLLQPGDTLLLAAGDYREGLTLHELSGAPGRPIVIAGPEQGGSATFVARAGRNTVSIVRFAAIC